MKKFLTVKWPKVFPIGSSLALYDKNYILGLPGMKSCASVLKMDNKDIFGSLWVSRQEIDSPNLVKFLCLLTFPEIIVSY